MSCSCASTSCCSKVSMAGPTSSKRGRSFERASQCSSTSRLPALLPTQSPFSSWHETTNTPCFSSSSLRFSAGIAGMRQNAKVGEILGCDAYGPCSLEEHHPDLFWYGVHGVETLFTIMGTGCERVSRIQTEGTELAAGVWKGGRIGTFRGLRDGHHDYGATVFGSKGIAPAGGYGGYEPLVVEIVKFFKTGKPPVSAAETIEIFAFMEAADESKRQGGKPVEIESVMAKAKASLTK